MIQMLFGEPSRLSGVLGVVAIGGKHVCMNLLRLLEFCFLLNINLAILNPLPIPPPDGGETAPIAVPFEEDNLETARLVVEFFEKSFAYLEMDFAGKILVPGGGAKGDVEKKESYISEAYELGARLARTRAVPKYRFYIRCRSLKIRVDNYRIGNSQSMILTGSGGTSVGTS